MRQFTSKSGPLLRRCKPHLALHRHRPHAQSGRARRCDHFRYLSLRAGADGDQLGRTRAIERPVGARCGRAQQFRTQDIAIGGRDVLLLHHVSFAVLAGPLEQTGRGQLADVIIHALARLPELTRQVGRGNRVSGAGENAWPQGMGDEGSCDAPGSDVLHVHERDNCLENKRCQQRDDESRLSRYSQPMRFSLVALAAVLAVGCGSDGEPPAVPGAVGSAAPAYGAVSMAGDSIDLASMRANVVLLNVWATWCIPCRREVPELQALHQEYEAKGLKVVGVSVDGGEAAGDVAAFMSDFSMTYTVLRDPAERVLTTFRIQGVPASYLIDRDGVVRWRTIGPFTAKDAALQTALNETL